MCSLSLSNYSAQTEERGHLNVTLACLSIKNFVQKLWELIKIPTSILLVSGFSPFFWTLAAGICPHSATGALVKLSNVVGCWGLAGTLWSSWSKSCWTGLSSGASPKWVMPKLIFLITGTKWTGWNHEKQTQIRGVYILLAIYCISFYHSSPFHYLVCSHVSFDIFFYFALPLKSTLTFQSLSRTHTHTHTHTLTHTQTGICIQTHSAQAVTCAKGKWSVRFLLVLWLRGTAQEEKKKVFSLFMCYQTAGGGVNTAPLDPRRGEGWTEGCRQEVVSGLGGGSMLTKT